MDLYTIGHSRHPIGKVIKLLKDQRIEVLVDIRSTPYSRFNPQFNQKALKQSIQEEQIDYIYAGDELGGRPSDPECYKHHAIPANAGEYAQELDYAKVIRRPWFLHGIQQLLEMAGKRRAAILCSEEDPAKCHRHQLIARFLMAEHPEVTVLHVRGDGSLVDARCIASPPDEPEAEQLSF